MTAPNSAAPLMIDGTSIPTLWNDSVQWLSDHSFQILIAAAIGAGIFFALLGIRRIGVKMCDKEDLTGWRTIIGRAISKTGTIFMVLVAAKLVSGYAQSPALLASTINFLFTITAVFQSAIWVREIALGMIERRAGTDAHHAEALGNAMGIIRLLITVTIFAIALILVLDNLGVNVTGLVAGLGIGGIAIGMAAKGIFDDLFAALSILFDKPFRRGDAIKWDSTSGTVEAIGLKTTRVRSVTGEEVVISNANLLNKELHNMARLRRRRHVLMIGVTYQTPPEVCAEIPAIIKEIVEEQEKCQLVRCGMTAFGGSSLDYEIQFDVMSETYEVVFAARHAVCVAILQRFNKEGIEFAYPTQTSFTAAPDGTLVMPYADDPAPPPVKTPAAKKKLS
ncbi:mechanosensitive ion channel family protein [Sphingobium boeckii]|uniref:Small-conductance mechanosensitive channel n=1 Tax=Sphingobium boeckii TaxID=1082345 RepID=A0A7W9EFS7_9SPHN|nr:mechanosensitive ion channel family protein [Sphingobium boeckii]MBB5686031.1 small-conductance mechanosensitive channel [Sphingobium boeckii]